MNISQTDIAFLGRGILRHLCASLSIFSLLSLIYSESRCITAILLQIGAFQSSLMHLWLYWKYMAFLHTQSPAPAVNTCQSVRTVLCWERCFSIAIDTAQQWLVLLNFILHSSSTFCLLLLSPLYTLPLLYSILGSCSQLAPKYIGVSFIPQGDSQLAKILLHHLRHSELNELTLKFDFMYYSGNHHL